MMNSIASFLRDERGLEAVEYAVVTGLIVAATVAAIASLGSWVTKQFQALNIWLSTP
jgi:Flp pilus assembly pilin Flp